MNKDQLKQLSIEGCELIGRGAHASVYRIAPDEIVKVYREDIPFDRVLMEKRRSKRALILKVPTAISFDIVKVGNCYGAVYELLDAEPTDSYVNRSSENLENFINMSVELLKHIHSIDADTAECADMKADHLKWVDNTEHLIGNNAADKLRDLIRSIPNSTKLLHGDFHLKNIIIVKGKPMLIDMDTLCFGDPIFDLATIANSYWIFPQMAPEAATVHLGISVGDAHHIWKRTLSLYFDGMSDDELTRIEQKARTLGLLRIIDFAQRSAPAEHRELLTQQGIRMLHEAIGAV